jgi:hypothetical protein
VFICGFILRLKISHAADGVVRGQSVYTQERWRRGLNLPIKDSCAIFPNFIEEGIMRAQLVIFRFPLKCAA